jgi:hypothetical protein
MGYNMLPALAHVAHVLLLLVARWGSYAARLSAVAPTGH